MIPLPTPTRLDRAIAYLSPHRALKRMQARMRLELAGRYRAAESTRLRKDWTIPLDDPTPDMSDLDTLRARSRDLNRNDAVASGTTDTMAVNVIGRGLMLQSRIRAERLGISEAEAEAIRGQAEAIWDEWSDTADSAGRLTWDEIQFLALRKIIEDGEILALPVMVTDEPWRRITRAIELLETDRLSAYGGPGVTDTGIEFGPRGQPIAYWIDQADHTIAKGSAVRIEARDSLGRPKILHLFRPTRPGQQRGVPAFAPVLTYFKDLSDYMEAEVVAARVSACLAVFVTQERPDLAGFIREDERDSGGKRIQSLEPGMINYLRPNEAINVVEPKRPGDGFAPFVEGVLRMIGASLGLPYELLIKDFSKTNYSSARAALLEGRRQFTTWRHWFARRFCQPIYELVLEEAYLRGLLDAPRFYDLRHEYTRAAWIGGGWGWVDPVKEVEASRLAIDYGLSTMAEEAAGQGRDWEEVLAQLRREQDRTLELGVSLRRTGKGDGNIRQEIDDADTKDQ